MTKTSLRSAENIGLCIILCSFPLSIISRYLVNRDRVVIFQTTLRQQLIPAEYEIGEVVVATGIATVAGHTFVLHYGLQETQSFDRQAHRGLCHIQPSPRDPSERRKRTAFPTGAAIQIQQSDKGSGGQIIGQNVPADQSVAPFPAKPEMAVGGVDQMVLPFTKMVAVALEQVTLGAEFLYSLLGCGGTALAEPGLSSKGNGHISTLSACQKEQDKGHPLGGVGQSSVGNQVVGYCSNRMQVGHLYGFLSAKFVRLQNPQGAPGQRMMHPCPGDIQFRCKIVTVKPGGGLPQCSRR